ncbi:MAG TPA: hypothetical protein VHO06_26235 [Polyangia bacterium]|nr:hypothetical protein [Polyangia bacterium]
MRARGAAVAAGFGCLAVFGCQSFPDPPVTFVAGLRVLGIKADPPEVAAGASSTIDTLAIDTDGATPAAAWSACLEPPLPGQTVNPDCVDTTAASFLQPIGSGLSITATMPRVTAGALGEPDASGGVYLPLVADVTAPASAVTAVYRLRLGGAAPANTNPTLASVYLLDAAGGMTALDPAAPTPVARGAALSLGVTFAPGSAESYTAADGSARTETLTTSWFATAGDFSVEKTSATQPQTVLRLDQRLPAAGVAIDLWAVARDERGGTDFAHRVLQLQ